MGRMPRFAPAGLPQHVTQRGNFGQDVFFRDDDRHFYLSLLDRHSAEQKVRVIGYALMTNHIHLLVEPKTDHGLATMMQCLQGEYSRVTNDHHRLRGQLWRHRYDACLMDETHLGIALAYVELNPVRAGITKTAIEYEWSSARAHTGAAPPHALLHKKSFTDRFTATDWAAILAEKERDEEAVREELAAIRRATRLNQPFAAADFIQTLENKHTRRLHRRPPGRPAKPKTLAA